MRARRADVPSRCSRASCLPTSAGRPRRRHDRRRTGKRRVGLLGLAFKSGTDDLRESPLVELAETPGRQGLRPADPRRKVAVSRLSAPTANTSTTHLPHLARAHGGASADEVVDHAEVCVVGAAEPGRRRGPSRGSRPHVVDLVRLPGAGTTHGMSPLRRCRLVAMRRPARTRPRREPVGALRPPRVAGEPRADRGRLPGGRHLPTRHRSRTPSRTP